jgi:hypothetical protein
VATCGGAARIQLRTSAREAVKALIPRKMETPRLVMRMDAVLEDEACHEDFRIGIGRKDVLKHIPEYHIRFTILSQ